MENDCLIKQETNPKIIHPFCYVIHKKGCVEFLIPD